MAPPIPKTAHVIALVNVKGGVGKTTSTANLAGILADEGFRVCAVDTDPQGNLSLDLGARQGGLSDDGAELLQATLAGRAPKPLVDVGGRPGLDLVCGGRQLHDLAALLDSRRMNGGGDGTNALTTALEHVAAGGYHFVIVDCPPGAPTLQESVLRAARWLLVPAKTDEGSLAGLEDTARRFAVARRDNPALTLLGVFLFGVNVTARRVLKEARADLESVLPRLGYDAVLTTTIRHVEATARAARRDGLLAHELDAQARETASADPDAVYSSLTPTGKLAEDYVNLTREVQQRILEFSRRAAAGDQATTQGPAQ